MPVINNQLKEIKNINKLVEIHPNLRLILIDLARLISFQILVGHRGEAEQNAAFKQGLSKLEWPNGAHNSQPSNAVDIAPLPIDWKDISRFYYVAGMIKVIANQRGIKIKWGGDWDSDNEFKDQTFNDLVHFELDLT